MGDKEHQQSLADHAARTALHLLVEVVRSVFSKHVAITAIVSVSVLLGIYLARIPDGDLAGVDVGSMVRPLSDVFASSLFGLGGWIIGALAVGVGFVHSRVLKHRLSELDGKIVAMREEQDPDRARAGDLPTLKEHTAQTEFDFARRKDGQHDH